EDRWPLLGSRLEERLDLLARDRPRVDVLALVPGVDRQERHEIVLERRRDRALEEVVELEQVAGPGRVAEIGVEPSQLAPGRQRLAVDLEVVEVVQDPADLDERAKDLPLARRQRREVAFEAVDERLVEDLAGLLRRPVAGGERHVILWHRGPASAPWPRI